MNRRIMNKYQQEDHKKLKYKQEDHKKLKYKQEDQQQISTGQENQKLKVAVHSPFLKNWKMSFVSFHHWYQFSSSPYFLMRIIIICCFKVENTARIAVRQGNRIGRFDQLFIKTCRFYIKQYNKLHLNKDCKLTRLFQMLNLLQKSLKNSKVFISIIFNTQSKRVFFKSRICGSKRHYMIWSLR